MVYKITISQDITGIAPLDCRWQAWFDEYDLDNPLGLGASEDEAVRDLFAKHTPKEESK